MKELKELHTDATSYCIAALIIAIWTVTLIYFSECIITISL